MNFRTDINALRAIAVTAVVLFHFKPDLLPSGFAGVDVFFVISGFLMTMIVFNGFENNKFSLIKFYKARAVRIIPALAILCLTLIVLGFIFLQPFHYLSLGKHVLSTLTFTSNIVYWTEAGYFNASSKDNWLLHTWSLSVEWQFYVLYPIALILLKKAFKPVYIKRIILSVTVLFLLLSVFITFKSSNTAYFMLPTRAWQMLAGGIVFLYPLNLSYRLKMLTQAIGLLFVFLSFSIFTERTPWPGYASFLPVFGTCLVLLANIRESFWSNNYFSSFIGKWSYSIYLWHWPIVVAGSYFSLGKYWWCIGILLSVCIGALSYIYIESKSLPSYKIGFLRYFIGPIKGALIVSLIGFFVFNSQGFVNRVAEPVRSLNLFAMEADKNWYYPKPNQIINGLNIRKIQGRSEKNILVLGASHIEQIYPYVLNLNSDYNIYFITKSGCLVVPSMRNPKWSCENLQNFEKIFKSINFEKIVTSFYSFDSYLPIVDEKRYEELAIRIKDYDKFLRLVKAKANEVVVILGEPIGDEYDPSLTIKFNHKDFISESTARSNYDIHNMALSKLEELDRVKVIDPINYLCSDGICKTRDSIKGFYYRDRNHMQAWYAIENLSYLNEVFK